MPCPYMAQRALQETVLRRPPEEEGTYPAGSAALLLRAQSYGLAGDTKVCLNIVGIGLL
jgi:hypothetical protein